jgi:sensor histidine kinase YesM
MLITLVENAIKHGIEPALDGGRIEVRAARHPDGRLVLSVADTGAGLHGALTGGQGIGLANIRERLALLFDDRATLELAGNAPCGFVARIVLPADAGAPRMGVTPRPASAALLPGAAGH